MIPPVLDNRPAQVVDPFNSDTAEMWRQRFGFDDSEQDVPGNPSLRRQWLRFQS